VGPLDQGVAELLSQVAYDDMTFVREVDKITRCQQQLGEYNDPMRFTPSQALDLVGITAETLRYWKKYMPSLAKKRGHAPCYTRAEIVGLIVVRRLVKDFRIDVSVLAAQSERLFDLCSAQWALPSSRLLRVTCDGRVTAHEALEGVDFAEAAIVFPLDKAIQELEDRLNEHEGEVQMELGLPPVSVKNKVRRAL
jgi:DNA-binding transcriptional MerR regulator